MLLFFYSPGYCVGGQEVRALVAVPHFLSLSLRVSLRVVGYNIPRISVSFFFFCLLDPLFFHSTEHPWRHWWRTATASAAFFWAM
jgi:hypothetical protein